MAYKVEDLYNLVEVVRESGVSRWAVKNYSMLPGADRFKVMPDITGYAYVLYKPGFIEFVQQERYKGFQRRGKQKKRKKPGPAKNTPNLWARKIKCPYCNGKGTDDGRTCRICKGKGKVRYKSLDRIVQGTSR